MPSEDGWTDGSASDGDGAWKRRLRAPVFTWAQIAAREPARGLIIRNGGGALQLHAWEVPTGTMSPVTDKPEGIASGRIAPDGRYISYFSDAGGNEIGHLVRVPFKGGPPEDITPGWPSYPPTSAISSRAGNVLGCTLASGGRRELVCIDVSPDGILGPPRSLLRAPLVIGHPVLSCDGEVAVTTVAGRDGGRVPRPQALDTREGRAIAWPWDGLPGHLEPIAFAPMAGDLRLAVAAHDRDGFSLWVVSLDQGLGSAILLGRAPGTIRSFLWSDDGRRIAFGALNHALLKLYVADGTERGLTHLPEVGGVFTLLDFSPDGDLLVLREDGHNPPSVVALDGRTGSRKRTLLAAPEAPPGRPWRSIAFPSSDGQVVQGWLGLPRGQGPFPVILDVHGGPAHVRLETYSPLAEAWLDHGFAFLSVNYRGSTSFGQRFRDQILGDPGRWEIEDLVAARAWLVGQGFARPDRVFLAGWSYGAFLTLLAMGRRPELWAGGMAGLAIADWAMNYEDAAEPLRAWTRRLFGGTPAELPDRYAACSPTAVADAVRAPLLIVQARNDTRCPPRQVVHYEKMLRSANRDLEMIWVESGHLLASVETAIAFQERMFAFVRRVLGGDARRGRDEESRPHAEAVAGAETTSKGHPDLAEIREAAATLPGRRWVVRGPDPAEGLRR